MIPETLLKDLMGEERYAKFIIWARGCTWTMIGGIAYIPTIDVVEFVNGEKSPSD